ncbi:hypothetical protein SAMN02745673_01884 [Marinactinospora thermotolerans DSM 45154]|uniref:Uncharacterized protein n=1 Tax=Marinactinospora thermotolerans DSM 45154 TaxID=1122192 RepID=A0A1T4PLM6_9ACTN|nr:hypothetical protein [Marinactinospora thermotolerans]SJZ92494.1 hypothetical protein SAMN02745673_01884 [Marinactinospora thermotolerans DSM 45154]
MPEQGTPGPLKLSERLTLVYERLDQMPPPTSAQESFDRLNAVLDQVEDEHSGVPKNPNPGLKFDGRMYPPREDFTERTADGRILAVTKGNTIEAHPDGTLTVSSRKTGKPVYHRQGAGQPLTRGSGPELKVENPAIAEAFEAVRRAQQGMVPPGKRPRNQSEARTQRRDTPQRGNDRGPER